MKELSILSTFALFLSAIENRMLIIRLGIPTGNPTDTRNSNSGYKSLLNEFESEKSVIWPTDTIHYTDYISNHGYQLSNFGTLGKSRQIEQTSSDEKIHDLKECKQTKLGVEYRGNLTSTKTGITCQAWNTQFPHDPSPWAKDVQNYPDDSIAEAENKCRNPDREPEGPWCYTTNPEIRWEYCDIPMCADKLKEAPQYSITLPGGFAVRTNLSIFNTSKNNQESCNYIGNLIGEISSVISATGCLKSSNMKYTNDTNAISIPRKKIKSQLTIFSSSTNISKYMVLENGNMLEVKPDGLKDLSTSDLTIARTAKIRAHKPLKVVPNDLVSNEKFPKELNITLVYGYERSVKDYFVNVYSSDWDTQMKNWIKDIHTHTQSYYRLTSLKTRINLQAVKEPTYIDEYLSLTKNDSIIFKSLRRLRKELPKLNHSNVHMYMWFTNLPTMDDEADLPPHEKSAGGITGAAKDPVICKARKNVALIRGPSRLDQNTAGTVAHELGHALGMFHDWLVEDPYDRYFNDSLKGKKVKCTGFMDSPFNNETTNTTIEPPNRWSGCSVHDFRSAFEQEKWDEKCFRDLFDTGTGVCLDYTLQNVRNRKDMKDGGWIVDGAPEHDNIFAEYCGGFDTFWGYAYGPKVGYVEATFQGSGTAILDFGNCYFWGVANAYINDVLIGSAASNNKSVVISFDYNRGDVLKITEEEAGILKINSLKLEACEKEGTCTCSNLTNGIYGKCGAEYQEGPYKGPICYVNEPSNCTDIQLSYPAGFRYSWEACDKQTKLSTPLATVPYTTASLVTSSRQLSTQVEKTSGHQGYSLIGDKGFCVHVSGEVPYQCWRYDVSSQSLCEEHCTSWTSCIAYYYYNNDNVHEIRCNLIPSERSCPLEFSPQYQSGPIAASMNELKFYPHSSYVCYGKA